MPSVPASLLLFDVLELVSEPRRVGVRVVCGRDQTLRRLGDA